MIIFEQEKIDGISEVISSNASIAYSHVATPSKSTDILKQSIASTFKETVDLFPIDSILVSTGWNLNTDVFLPKPTWAARKTPINKQFNYMHDENKIIGHMINAYAIDKNGEKIADDISEPPTSFDILTQTVIYKTWQKAENQEWMDKILAEIEQGLWFVSMECLFNNFDYAVLSPEGESSLIERNESTAFLSKHLRAYGGDGEYQGYKIGRALDNFIFSGKGLVYKPANPESIILKSKADFDLNSIDFKNVFTSGECNMDELKKQIEELKAELSKAKAENADIKKDFEAKRSEETQSLIAKKEEDINAKAEEIASLQSKIEEYESQINDLNRSLANKDQEVNTAKEELAKANEVLESIKTEQIVAGRVQKLVKAGFSEDEAKEHVELYTSLSDEAFDKIAAKFEDMKKDKSKDEEDKDKSKDKEKKEKTEASLFEDVQTETSIQTEEEDKLKELRHSVASWFSDSVGLKDN